MDNPITPEKLFIAIVFFAVFVCIGFFTAAVARDLASRNDANKRNAFMMASYVFFSLAYIIAGVTLSDLLLPEEEYNIEFILALSAAILMAAIATTSMIVFFVGLAAGIKPCGHFINLL